MINKDEFNTVNLGSGDKASNISFYKDLYSYVEQTLKDYKTAREKREETWLECWAMYLGTKEARDAMKGYLLREVGNVNNNWRHNITTGKAFEQVETIVSYLQQAFFPNRDWFDAVPTEPGYAELAKIVKNFTKKKLTEANFISYWEMFLRQAVITGWSILALPWRYETKKQKKKVKVNAPADINGFKFVEREIEKIVYNNTDFEVLDIFDVYLNPTSVCANSSELIRRVVKTRAEVAEMITSGYYKNVSLSEIAKADAYTSYDDEQRLVKQFQGYTITDTNWSDNVELFEYWGDVVVNDVCYKDVVVTWGCGKVLRFENNPFWGGKPFVIATYTPIVRSPSALGAIEPSLGMLHELDILTNQRLDNLELSTDTMFEYINDGSLQPEDIYTQPGKVFTVSQPNTIRPIQSSNNFTVTYDESAILEQRIDKNAGTGFFISANSARSGERVTAAEVQATRDAGGNRLSGVHKHIEEVSLLPLLEKIYRCYQQFITEDEVIRIPGSDRDSYDYVAVGEEELSYDFKLVPVGADHVADKEYEVNQRVSFLQLAGQSPEVSQYIDYYAFLVDIARKMGIDDIDQFVKQQQAVNSGSIDMMSQQPESIAQELGQPTANALQAQLMADGGASLAKDVYNVDINPQMAQTMLGGLQ